MNCPKPETPLPWRASTDEVFSGDERVAACDGENSTVADLNAAYIAHAANAFPHLVRALEAIINQTNSIVTLVIAEDALAIAREEVKP
jgi:hypothetical protein